MTAFERLCDRLGAAPGSTAAKVISATVNDLIFSDKDYSDEEIIEMVAARFIQQGRRGTEQNQGYEIIAAETYGTSDIGVQYRFVLGRMETKCGTMYVTWDSAIRGTGTVDYFWGHYFTDEKKARADYHRRLLEQYDR